MKKILFLTVVLGCALFSASCQKLEDVLNPQTKTTSVTIFFSDEVGKYPQVDLQIIDPVADRTTSFRPVIRYSKPVTCSGSVTYTFNDITPGTYAGMLSGINETYAQFKIYEGEQVTVNYYYYAGGYIIVGDPSTGYHTVPNNKWQISISKN